MSIAENEITNKHKTSVWLNIILMLILLVKFYCCNDKDHPVAHLRTPENTCFTLLHLLASRFSYTLSSSLSQ